MLIDMDFLSEVARDLPIIRPIKEFIHLNLLLPYQHLPFWNALTEVSAKFEAHPLPELEHYRKKIKSGELPLVLLRDKLDRILKEDSEQAMKFILEGKFEFIHHDSRTGKLHDCWNEYLGINIIQLADGMLIKWLSMFMDQGIGHWQMPESGERSFYDCLKNLIFSSYIVPAPFRKLVLSDYFLSTPEETIEAHLKFLCPDEDLQKTYIRESIMTLRGWAGLIYNIQQSPQLLPFPRKIDLLDFLAIKLILERAWIEQESPITGHPVFPKTLEPLSLTPEAKKNFLAFRACQEALEEATYDQYLKTIIEKQDENEALSDYQAIFCMDDRESSLRRFLEETSSRIETFGTAGHYGINCLYHHPEDAFPKKQCPAPAAVEVYLRDVPIENENKRLPRLLKFKNTQPTGNFLKEWFFSHLNAVSSTMKLTSNLFFPLGFKSLENVIEIKSENKLKLFRDESVTAGDSKLPEGYTLNQMVDLVYQQLVLIGFIHHFSPLIFIIGHGSNSVNNPYFATYGCGACSGRSGAANARAFVEMANNVEVRELLKAKYGLFIPSTTYFIAGFHDTTRDVIELYESHSIPSEQKCSYERFKKYLSIALYKNARERSKSFKLVTYRPVSKQAQKEVLRRSYSLFETRPELGHTGVAFAIVGRRDITKGLIPDQPAFLQSYDPSVDPDGKLLATTLGAVIPVCSGINLDYFFSRVDNLRFGAGSKLPQNIVGNLGVSHGTESDLLFGLPFQMIDQHQPLRLFLLIEQKPEIALAAIQNNPLVKQIVYNHWVHYACFDPSIKKIFLFENGQMLIKENFQELV